MACRQQRPKRELARVVRGADGRVAVDPTGKKSGRGAYLCRQASCWEVSLKKDLLSRALKAPVSSEDRAALAAEAGRLTASRAEIPPVSAQEE